MFDLEREIRRWRSHLAGFRGIESSDLLELESHLRDTIDELSENQNISEEEAFLLAVRRLGDSQELGREFSKVSTQDVWKQLLLPVSSPGKRQSERKELTILILLTILAGFLGKLPSLLGYGDIDEHPLVYQRNAALIAFFPVALYLFWKQPLKQIKSMFAVLLFPVTAAAIHLYPSYDPHHTSVLAAMHLPILLLYVLMYLYGGPSTGKTKELGRTGWMSEDIRMDFVRFAGESFIFAMLLGAGGMVLIFLTLGTFEIAGADASMFVQNWMAPIGFFNLFIVSAYLVSQKKSLIESMAPVLARIFTPLFLLVTLGLIIALVVSQQPAADSRSMLIWFDIVLVFVVALTLYSMSAEGGERHKNRTVWDVFSCALIISALIVDTFALSGIITRLQEYGFTANKSAALGENVILFVNLLLLGTGYVRYLIFNRSFRAIVAFQMRFLTVYAVWAVFVVAVLPFLFGFR
jgi:hypothetical protein